MTSSAVSPQDRSRPATELPASVRDNALFRAFSEPELQRLAQVIEGPITIAKGAYLVREGEQADLIYVVQSGSFEILKAEPKSATEYRIATLGAGTSIGEVSLLDAGPRSASVRALEDSAVMAISIAELRRLSSAEESVETKMKLNLAHEMGRRLRATNEAAVKSLREQLDEAKTRIEMGKFINRVLVILGIYMYALGAATALTKTMGDTTLVSMAVLLMFAVGLFLTFKYGIYPLSVYGITTRGWKYSVREGVLFSLPMLGLMWLCKWLLVEYVPGFQGFPVFDLFRSHHLSPAMLGFSILGYFLFVPFQELTRAGIQRSLQMFLTGRYRTLNAIFLANLFFSATHLHVSLLLAMLVFPLGMFWGWLFSRHTTLLGTIVSHILMGGFGMFVLGFPLDS
jgi:CRP-like cAMP-binding protein